jgi:hypothetical protein
LHVIPLGGSEREDVVAGRGVPGREITRQVLPIPFGDLGCRQEVVAVHEVDDHGVEIDAP